MRAGSPCCGKTTVPSWLARKSASPGIQRGKTSRTSTACRPISSRTRVQRRSRSCNVNLGRRDSSAIALLPNGTRTGSSAGTVRDCSRAVNVRGAIPVGRLCYTAAQFRRVEGGKDGEQEQCPPHVGRAGRHVPPAGHVRAGEVAGG